MKIMTILGTRPEIIRLSLIIPKLDAYADRHILVHTGQNYDRRLSDIFFEQMGVRLPDHHIPLVAEQFGAQIGGMFKAMEEIIATEQPDGVLLLGDTNSALCALLATRMGVPVYHMEAGNRCFDATVPEETNRRVIDAISRFNLPYTPCSRENLLREGIPSNRIWVSGNPIYEVLQHYEPQIEQSDILTQLNLAAGEYIVMTAHRAENVDQKERLENIMQALQQIRQSTKRTIVCSIHPRTANRLRQHGIQVVDPQILLLPPFGLFDFIKLQKNACCVITDSGTVQEESCIFGIPAVTIRQSTERPETVVCGSNVIAGLEAQRIAKCVDMMIGNKFAWPCPDGYMDGHVSTKIVNFILGGLCHV